MPGPVSPCRVPSALLTSAVAISVVACSDLTRSGRPDSATTEPDTLSLPADLGPPIALAVRELAGDTLAQRGAIVVVRHRDGDRIRYARLWVDSATNPQHADAGGSTTATYDSLVLLAVAEPGQRRITVSVLDNNSYLGSASRTVTFAQPDVQYMAAALQDYGRDAGALWVHEDGTVAGWVTRADGRRRPAVWRRGALSEVPVPDSTDAAAVRVNRVGDVLVERTSTSFETSHLVVLLWRPDGSTLVLSDVNPAGQRCCRRAGGLNDARLAVASTRSYDFVSLTVSANAQSGAVAMDGEYIAFTHVNAAGQLAGTFKPGSTMYPSVVLKTRGFAAGPLPAARQRWDWRCDRFGRFTETLPLGLDDAGALVTSTCGAVAYRPPSGESLWLDRRIGFAQDVELSRQGGVVAAREPDGRLLVWHAPTDRARRVRLPDATWRIDSIGGVNAAGVIAASGTHLVTGKRTALLLTPVAP